jgi:hypothetical protein
VEDKLPPNQKQKPCSRVLSLYPCQKKSVYRSGDRRFPQRVHGLRKDFVSNSHFVRCSHLAKPENLIQCKGSYIGNVFGQERIKKLPNQIEGWFSGELVLCFDRSARKEKNTATIR